MVNFQRTINEIDIQKKIIKKAANNCEINDPQNPTALNDLDIRPGNLVLSKELMSKYLILMIDRK